eukprot:m.43872 g.43872  ORF g.43872 m.43872 type:complete len:1317 (-) comp10017_c0_seq2:599-4549(-)
MSLMGKRRLVASLLIGRWKSAAGAVGLAAALVAYKEYLKATADPNEESPPTLGQALEKQLEKIKIVDVVRYTITLMRDLAQPHRLSENRKNHVKRLLSIVWPKFFGPSSPKTAGRWQISSLFAIAILRTWLMDRAATMTRSLSSVVFKRGTPRLQGILPECLFLVVLGSGLSAAREYCTQALTLTFRVKLTSKIHESYFSGMNYYHIANLPGREAIGDADERLATQIGAVSSRLTNLVQLLAKSIPPIIWFTVKLWRWQGMSYAMIPHLYLLLAYEAAQRLFPKNIGELYRNKAKEEFKFRNGASRIQTHSEAITALNGFPREKEILQEKFSGVRKAMEDLHLTNSKFGLIFKLFYTYGCRSWMTSFMMLPVLMLAKQGVLADEVSAMRYSWHMMIEMLVANGNILTMHAQAQHMHGICGMICKLMDTLQKLSDKQKATKATTMMEGDCIKFENVNILTPTQFMLVTDLTFELQQHSSLLLTGHNGAGKSSIFRVLGGLWSTPTGLITKPGANSSGLHQDIFYLPQKPYNVLGSLKANITYPKDPSDPNVKLSRGELEDLLAMVDLSHLLEEFGYGNDAEELINWEDKLSLGEQQRLAMARLFFHRPKYAILDECTSAVTNSMEVLLYQECRRLGISYITICHRPALRAWHDLNLHLLGDGKGGYKLERIEKTPGELDVLQQKPIVKKKAGDKAVNANQVLVDERSHPYSMLKKQKKPPRRRNFASRLKKIMKIMLPGSYPQLAMLIGTIGLRTLCHEFYSYVVGTLYKAMISRDIRTFALFSFINVISDMSTACVEEAVVYLQNMLGVTWYVQLTRHTMDRLFEANAFYKLRNIDKRVTDPDQRLTQEIQEAATEFANIWGTSITPMVDVLWFSYRLYRVITVRGMRDLYLYIALSAFVIKYFMPNHEEIDKKEKKLESRFRFIHNRLRNHSESVAFFGGDETEHAIATKHFSSLIKHSLKAKEANSKFKFIFHAVNKDFGDPSNMLSSPDLLLVLLQADFVDSTQLSLDSSEIASQVFYLQSAANRAISAFGKLTNVYEHLVKLSGSAARICELLDVLDEMRADIREDKLPIAHEGQIVVRDRTTHSSSTKSVPKTQVEIEVAGVDLVTPSGVCLAKQISLRLKQGHSLLITGPNATGKTSFFRVLSGLWPLHSGKTTVPVGGILLVPQRVYSVSGSLADQVSYPKKIVNRSAEDETFLGDCLDKVGVKYLIERSGGWDTVKRWEDTLSLGEQQRIGVSRLLFHGPTFGVLDECTDAVSVDVEHELYAALHKNNISCITISKRLALESFHDQHLTLGEPTELGWSVADMSSNNI